jgi:hypothetical protein
MIFRSKAEPFGIIRKNPCYEMGLMTAATARRAAARARAEGLSVGFGRISRGAENGELQRALVALALGTGNFLSPVQDQALVTRSTIITNIFIDRHGIGLLRSGNC